MWASSPGCTDPAGDPAGESAPWAGGRGGVRAGSALPCVAGGAGRDVRGAGAAGHGACAAPHRPLGACQRHGRQDPAALHTATRGVIHAFSGSLHQAEVFWQLGFRLGIGGSSAMSGPTRPGRRYARCRWRPCCWKPTLPTCRCRASRGGEHAGQPADHSPLVGTIAAATAGGCYFGVT